MGHEPAEGGQRVGGRRPLGRQIRVVGVDVKWPGLHGREAVAHLEETARADAEEAVAPEPLAPLDRFEQVGRSAVVEPEECPDRGLEVGIPGRRQQDRVGVADEPLRGGQAERVGGGHRARGLQGGCSGSGRGPENQKRPIVPGRKVVPSAVPPSFGVCRTHLTDGSSDDPLDPSAPIGAARYRWRSAPEPTGDRSRWVRRLPGPFPAVAAPVSISHWVSVPTCDG